MDDTAHRAIAVVGLGAILPDAPSVAAFWQNLCDGRYSIGAVPEGRWDPGLYYDPDPAVPDKTYSKIGGWVREAPWAPVEWKLPIPPRVSDAMDEGQKWAIACTRQALDDLAESGHGLDPERTAVVLGNAMAGEKHYLTVLRIQFPEFADELAKAPSFGALPRAARDAILRELHAGVAHRLPEITEDTMPGELANCIAGRIANLFNFRGPNYVVDAACASALAAISAAAEGLIEGEYDAVVAGGIDRNMGASSFTKFCKIGALSATGTRPYADGADGFVMGEGAAVFVLKRLADAERAGNRVYAVIRGLGGSSDGKGKGITAPNPVGQRLSIERAWRNAGLAPATATYVEGHGTSTRVGDLVEVQSLSEVFAAAGAAPGTIALGSVKSNIGHLKAAAGAAGLLKTVLALHHEMLPPSLHCERPNPGIDFAASPFRVNTAGRPWEVRSDEVRRAGISAFGFGGTNFHAVVEQFVPGRLDGTSRRSRVVSAGVPAAPPDAAMPRPPLRGALVLGAPSVAALAERVRTVAGEAGAGVAPAPAPPEEVDLRQPERLAIDYGDAAELADRAARALDALASDAPAAWKALRAQGIFRGHGAAPKVAFLYTGQGSQYVNMLKGLRAAEPIVADTFALADRVMSPLLGRPLTDYIFAAEDAESIASAEEALKQTAVTQPAVLAADAALTRLLAAYGIVPDLVMGHSLGEYGALVAAGALPFEDALEAVSARGREMTSLTIEDCGAMAAVLAPLDEVERILGGVEGYVEIANLNSTKQCVIGGATAAVERAIAAVQAAEYTAIPLPVSHAFHTRIVAPASEPLRLVLGRLRLQSPTLPIVANVSGEFYPMGPGVAAEMVDILGRQVASPVQFVKGLETLYAAGARVFVEVGPKRALQGFADDVLGGRPDVVSLFTNHPKLPDAVAFNQALCGLYAAGLGVGRAAPARVRDVATAAAAVPAPAPLVAPAAHLPVAAPAGEVPAETQRALGRLALAFLERASGLIPGAAHAQVPVVVTGAALGLPGTEHVFDDDNVGQLLHGAQLIDVIPARFRHAILDKHITRLVKSDEGGHFEVIEHESDVLKLAARGGAFDLGAEFGVPAERLGALDRTTQLAIGAGIDALRDAGIPLVMRYRTTSKGTRLPERFELPEPLRDETGVIFASAFPGYDAFAAELADYHSDRARREELALLEGLRTRLAESANGHDLSVTEVDRLIHDRRTAIERQPYAFDRRFLFRVLSMGHSQFAELIGARGPNTQVNAACASTTQALGLAEDWIHAGRCRRVIVIAADDVTSDHLLEWFGAGFLSTGAAATDDVIEEAALPFDRRRHGMILGMGAAAIVVEHPDAARERGIQPVCEVVATVTANSAFHGTRLDVEHIGQVMEQVVACAEARTGIPRAVMAPQLMFVSHETYTPARGGSAAAEVHALRQTFGANAERIVVANTKGFTGHPMAVGIEDVVAVKALETGLVPPVANFKEVDPELGPLHLSPGGAHDIEWALRLGAGFGSQISMVLLRRTPLARETRPAPDELGYASRVISAAAWREWLARMSGEASPELEVVARTLRVKERAGAARPVAVAAVASPLPVPVAAPAPAAVDPVEARVLAVVAEKTGYPPDMLALDLDLEADLGVDTVKQAETFAAVRQAYDIPRDDKLKLRDFPTLAHVIQFVYDRRPDLVAARAAVPAAAPAPAAGAVAERDEVRERVLAIVAEKTGYPSDMLALDLDLEADLGVDTVKQAETFAAVRQAYDIPRDDKLKLRDFPTLAHVIQFVYDRRPDLVAARAAVPAAAPAPAAGAVAERDEVRERVLAIVAEKTGYPSDMLALDLDLEADLGVDTVKQAETFAAVRQAYDIPRDDKLKLRDFPTLAHVIQFVYDRRPDLGQGAGAASDDTTSRAPAAAPVPDLRIRARVPRRVPVPVLRPGLDLCVPTGVTLTGGSRVLVMADGGGVAEALATRLRTEGVTALVVDDAPAAETLEQRVLGWLADGPIQGVYWLPALDGDPDLAEMDITSWREALRVRAKLLHVVLRLVDAGMEEPGRFLVAATRLGGRHGYDDVDVPAPMGGAVTGLVKAYRRERAALVKAVDFESTRAPAEIADVLVAETLADPGAVEIGYAGGLRWTVGLADAPAADGQPGLVLGRETVFVVTGAAGGIVSAIVADLAAASGGSFHLLDRVPEPKEDDPDVARLDRDRDGLKRDLAERLRGRGERPTPALVERELAALERAQTALDALHAVRRAGGTASYHAVDLLDAAAVAGVVDEIRRHHGRIDVLLHAAGLEVSHLVGQKPATEFDRVLDVKCDGWFNLMRAAADLPIGAAVAFSSIAGRFGNRGQTDYSAANDLLCKWTAKLRTVRPAMRAIAIDWTAWSDIGMASRGSIPTVMAAAGIDMLHPDDGIPIVRAELTAGGTRGEVVIADRLGVLVEEWHATGGLDPARAERLVQEAGGPVLGSVVEMGVHGGLAVETILDARQPFLGDHRIDGTPVLPGVMGIEAFAEVAALLVPGWHVHGVEDVHFLAPFKLYRDEPRAARIEATLRADGDGLLADCRLLGSRKLPAQDAPQVTTHFTARIRLRRPAPAVEHAEPPPPPNGRAVTAEDIYRVYFHGPAYRVLERVWRDGDRVVGLMARGLPPDRLPAGCRTRLAPRLIELCFQTAGIAELARTGRMGLPERIERVVPGQPDEETDERLFAVVSRRADGAFDAHVVDGAGTVHVALHGYRTVELPASVADAQIAALQAVAG